MDCPRCKNKKTKVVESRPYPLTVSRIRVCKGCQYYFKTEEHQVTVIVKGRTDVAN